MKANLYRPLKLIAKILAVLIAVVLLIYLFGEVSYIAVPLIVAAAFVIYILYDIDKKRVPLKKYPDWDTYVKEQDDSRVRKLYRRETREIHSRAGRQKHKEARLRNRHR